MHWKAQSLLRDINIAVQNVREREQDARVREHTIQELNQLKTEVLHELGSNTPWRVMIANLNVIFQGYSWILKGILAKYEKDSAESISRAQAAMQTSSNVTPQDEHYGSQVPYNGTVSSAQRQKQVVMSELGKPIASPENRRSWTLEPPQQGAMAAQGLFVPGPPTGYRNQYNPGQYGPITGQWTQYSSGQYGTPALADQYSPHAPYSLPYPPRTRREPLTNVSETETSQDRPGDNRTHSRGISDISFATFGISRSSGESSHNSHYYDATSNSSGSQSSHHGRRI